MAGKKVTPKQFLAKNPNKYVMVTYEFGDPLYIAPLLDMKVQVTSDKTAAEIWSELDKTNAKLNYHIICTGFKGLTFEKI